MELSFEGISGANTEKYDDLGIDLPLYSPERICKAYYNSVLQALRSGKCRRRGNRFSPPCKFP